MTNKQHEPFGYTESEIDSHKFTDTQIEDALVDHLYRYDCAAPAALQHYAWGMLSAEAASDIEQHIEHCVLCHHAVTQHQQIIKGVSKADTSYTHGAVLSLREGAKQAVAKTQFFLAEFIEDVQDRVDTVLGGSVPAYASLRGKPQRSLLYEAGGAMIDLQIRPDQEPLVMLSGQIMGLPTEAEQTSTQQSAAPSGKFRLTSQSKFAPPIEGELNRHGSFSTNQIDPGNYQLTIELPNATYTILDLTVSI